MDASNYYVQAASVNMPKLRENDCQDERRSVAVDARTPKGRVRCVAATAGHGEATSQRPRGQGRYANKAISKPTVDAAAARTLNDRVRGFAVTAGHGEDASRPSRPRQGRDFCEQYPAVRDARPSRKSSPVRVCTK